MVALVLIFALAGTLSCASAHEPGPPKPAPMPVDTTPAQPAPVEPAPPAPPAPAPLPPPPPPPAPVVAVAPKPPAPKPKPKPKPKPAVAVAVVPKPKPKPKPATKSTGKVASTRKPRPKPKPKGPTARELFVRDSIARDAFVRDSLTREAAVRDSLARVAFVNDSLRRAAFVRDSVHRVALVRDSIAREVAYNDSLARARARADTARTDSLYGVDGAMPRIEGDVNIRRPTAGLELIFVDQVWDTYQQVTFIYARPFAKRKASWEIDIPIQHFDSISGGKSVTSLANISLIVNRRLNTDSASWRQTISLQLQPQTGLEDPSIGNNQWIIQPQYAISHWFGDNRFHFRSLTYWQYGFAPDTSAHPTKRNIIVPRLVLTGRLNSKWDATADLRPRIDITRNAFYSTLMFLVSRPFGDAYGFQAGYEFPLDSMAKQKVEKSKVYLNLSYTF